MNQNNRQNEYVIICDESNKKDVNYSYFYGGAMLLENKYQKISEILNNYKNKFGFTELKRTKITIANYKSYIDILDLFFTFVKSGDIKIRIMFSPNSELMHIPKHENFTYTKLYLAFIVNAFNIFYAKKNIKLRLIFDDLPETKEQCSTFKKCLYTKINKNISKNKLCNKAKIKKDAIEEVDSKKHIILQCVDVIVGVTDFFLNTTPEEINQSKRAFAKNQVWQYVKSQIYLMNPNFILTETTKPVYSHKGWIDNYRHFVYSQKSKK